MYFILQYKKIFNCLHSFYLEFLYSLTEKNILPSKISSKIQGESSMSFLFRITNNTYVALELNYKTTLLIQILIILPMPVSIFSFNKISVCLNEKLPLPSSLAVADIA